MAETTTGDLAFRLPCAVSPRRSDGDDRAFCERVSEALGQGYTLHGSPAIVVKDGKVITAQAVVKLGHA